MVAISEFLARWSRLKSAAPETTTSSVSADATPAASAALGTDGDIGHFMKADVPEEHRRAALRALWDADPSLSAPDGLLDYAGDYREAAVAEAAAHGSYRVGQGYLSDDEAETWASLGETRRG